MDILKIAGVIIFSYLMGSILTGEIVAYFKKVDLRSQGSGNIGATNVFRSMGAFYGSLVLIGDALKGVISVLLGNFLGRVSGLDLGVLAGVFAIIGHNWSLYAKFKGGKGIATSLGVVVALTPVSLIILLPVWIGITLLSRFISLASILAAISYPVSVFCLYPNDIYKLVFSGLLAVLAVYRHKPNIKRLIRGEEHKISFKNRKDANK